MAGWAGRLCVVLLSPPTVLPGGYQHRCHVGTEFSIQSALEVLAGVSRNSRSRPFPGMKAVPKSWEWIFPIPSRSQILGISFFHSLPFLEVMDFFLSLPVLELWEWFFFHSLPVPEFWEWVFPFSSRSQTSGMELS